MSENRVTEFEHAASQSEKTLAGELLGFLRQNGKWGLLPLIVILLIMAGLILLSGTAAAPFIYTLF